MESRGGCGLGAIFLMFVVLPAVVLGAIGVIGGLVISLPVIAMWLLIQWWFWVIVAVFVTIKIVQARRRRPTTPGPESEIWYLSPPPLFPPGTEWPDSDDDIDREV